MKIVFGAKLELWPEDGRDEAYLESMGLKKAGDKLTLTRIPIARMLEETEFKGRERVNSFYLTVEG